jgi:hypothetical protein
MDTILNFLNLQDDLKCLNISFCNLDINIGNHESFS